MVVPEFIADLHLILEAFHDAEQRLHHRIHGHLALHILVNIDIQLGIPRQGEEQLPDRHVMHHDGIKLRGFGGFALGRQDGNFRHQGGYRGFLLFDRLRLQMIGRDGLLGIEPTTCRHDADQDHAGSHHMGGQGAHAGSLPSGVTDPNRVCRCTGARCTPPSDTSHGNTQDKIIISMARFVTRRQADS